MMLNHSSPNSQHDSVSTGLSSEMITSAALLNGVLNLASASSEIGQALAFVDTTVSGYEQLVAGMDSDIEIVLFDPSRNAIDQITSRLSGKTNITSLHIFSHGAAGSVQLGKDLLSQSTLTQYQDELMQWAGALTDDADILFYGCNVGHGTVGQNFVSEVARLTGADVAASDDLTGNASLNGDWQLEVSTGQIEADSAIDAKTGNSFDGVLATFEVTNLNNSGAGSLRQAIANANAVSDADTIIFSGSIFQDDTPDVIELTSGQLQIKHELNLIGPGSEQLTIRRADSADDFRIMLFAPGSDAQVSGLTLANGRGDYGGAIQSFPGVQTFRDLRITGNNASLQGGGIYNLGSDQTLINVTIDNNTADKGGGIYHRGGGQTLTNVTIHSNTAVGFGGGIYSRFR